MLARLHNALKLLTVARIFPDCSDAQGSHQVHIDSHNKLRNWFEDIQTANHTRVKAM